MESSILKGMGPICAAKTQEEAGEQQKGKGHIVTGHAGKGDDIVLYRDNEGRPCVNLYQSKTCHSPSGFEWGYGGSGPADLALNILMIYLPFEKAWELHQDFKWNFVATVPSDGGIIKGQAIQEYVEDKAKTLFDGINQSL